MSGMLYSSIANEATPNSSTASKNRSTMLTKTAAREMRKLKSVNYQQRASHDSPMDEPLSLLFGRECNKRSSHRFPHHSISYEDNDID
ncbi:hypothetical protein AB6A40_001650 [Gnathostoma spinigerum]|uniref:Uncharacterized protein n=1 Tax=Gnathostoma spinigerum TaxID=75299 RepID=A0ABD6E701_9BILA